MKKKRIGIIGCGTIGSTLAQRIVKGFSSEVVISALCDVDGAKAHAVKKKLRLRARVCQQQELIETSDIIIEAASGSISYEIAAFSLRKHKTVVLLSIGGLVHHVTELTALLKRSRGTLLLPSGAICGIDGILAGKTAGITKSELITRKPLKGLRGAPYFKHAGIDENKITKETVIFSGTAKKAITYFPKNVNVAALLSLASLGIHKTKVTIITSPFFKSNSHEIQVEGAFGRLTTRSENVPSPTNPKTSYLAILAAEATLRKYLSPIKIGT